MRLTESSALVTGGASGLGYATAERLVRSGAQVVIVDLPGSAGEEAAAALGATFVAADVTDPEQVRRAVETAQELAPLRVAVSCAGIAPPAKIVSSSGEPSSFADFARVVSINLIGTYHVVALAGAAMSGNDPVEGAHRGVIVNTASVAAFDGQIGQAAYAASKGGVHSLTLPAAREFARHGIRVCTIAPGIMQTPMVLGLPEAAQESLGKQVPFPARPGHPEEFAGLVQHIIENDYLNGETIRLDGAIRMAPK